MSDIVARDFTSEELQLIKDTVAKGATDNELKLFLHRCKNMSLDPLKPGQVHFIKFGTNPGTMVVGIDGFRSRAIATGKHRGTQRGVTRDDKGRVVAAWCEVKREGWDIPAREEVALAEYSTGKSMWAKMPETMLKKVAEVAALRMAFPDELGGIYSDDEMAQAEPTAPVKDVSPAHMKKKEPGPQPLAAPGPKISRDQIAEILSLANSLNVSNDELAAYCKKQYGKSGADLSMKEARSLTEYLSGKIDPIDQALGSKPPLSEKPLSAAPPTAKAHVRNHAPTESKKLATATPSTEEEPKKLDPAARAHPDAVQALWQTGIDHKRNQHDMDEAVLAFSGLPDWDVLTNGHVDQLRALFVSGPMGEEV